MLWKALLDRVAHCLPPLFNVFINAFIVNLRLLDVGCHVNHKYVGCYLYDEEVIFIPLSIIGLQQMLVVSSATAKSFAFKFNGNKSYCLSLGKLGDVDTGLMFDNQSIVWYHSIK